MKIFISADLEGIGGITHREHTARDGMEHQRARELMTLEVNAAVEGALEAGATEVIVNDSHGTMRNLIPEMMHEEAILVTGSPKHLSMMEGIDMDCDGVVYIGYHARMGVSGIISHTYDSRVVVNVRLNGQAVGEAGLNSMVAGHLGVPVLMLSGDVAAIEDARTILGDFVGVAVKEAVTRTAVKGVHPEKARKMIKEGMKEAIARKDEFTPLTFDKPVTVELEFFHTGMADMAETIPGSVRVNDRTVAYTGEDPMVVFKAFRAMITLAGTVV
jgi:D-amino peptidase